MIQWQEDLCVPAAGLWLDSRGSRPLCFVSHAHSDHLGRHDTIIATPATTRIAEYRNFSPRLRQVQYRQELVLSSDFVATCLPAGHVLGSAMLHLRGPEESLLYTGDFKLRACRTVEYAQPRPADVLLMESTYGRPEFRFPPRATVEQELVERCAAALHEGRQPIVMGYALGKSQELIRILTDAGLPVTAHGAVFGLCQLYRELGVELGAVRKYEFGDFHGASQVELSERGVLVAPPNVARTPFVTRFLNPLRIVCTGWALQRGAQYRYGVDVALPISDHADFDELLELIEIVRPKRVYTHHGFVEFVDHLRMRGIEAQLARPEAQLRLFE